MAPSKRKGRGGSMMENILLVALVVIAGLSVYSAMRQTPHRPDPMKSQEFVPAQAAKPVSSGVPVQPPGPEGVSADPGVRPAGELK